MPGAPNRTLQNDEKPLSIDHGLLFFGLKAWSAPNPAIGPGTPRVYGAYFGCGASMIQLVHSGMITTAAAIFGSSVIYHQIYKGSK